MLGEKNTECSGSGPPWAICEQYKINMILTLLKIKMCEKRSSEQWSARKECWNTNHWSSLGITSRRPSSEYQYVKRLTCVYRSCRKTASECYHLQPICQLDKIGENKKGELTATTKQFSAHLTHSFYPGYSLQYSIQTTSFHKQPFAPFQLSNKSCYTE